MSTTHPGFEAFKTYCKDRGAVFSANSLEASQSILLVLFCYGDGDLWDLTHGLSTHYMNAVRALTTAGLVAEVRGVCPARIHITDVGTNLVDDWKLFPDE